MPAKYSASNKHGCTKGRLLRRPQTINKPSGLSRGAPLDVQSGFAGVYGETDENRQVFLLYTAAAREQLRLREAGV